MQMEVKLSRVCGVNVKIKHSFGGMTTGSTRVWAGLRFVGASWVGTDRHV